MKVIQPFDTYKVECLLSKFFYRWKENDWTLGHKRQLVFFDSVFDEYFVVDFNQSTEDIIIQVHNFLAVMQFPVELDYLYWKFIKINK